MLVTAVLQMDSRMKKMEQMLETILEKNERLPGYDPFARDSSK